MNGLSVDKHWYRKPINRFPIHKMLRDVTHTVLFESVS